MTTNKQIEQHKFNIIRGSSDNTKGKTSRIVFEVFKRTSTISKAIKQVQEYINIPQFI